MVAKTSSGTLIVITLSMNALASTFGLLCTTGEHSTGKSINSPSWIFGSGAYSREAENPHNAADQPNDETCGTEKN